MELKVLRGLYQNAQYAEIVKDLGEEGAWRADESLYLGLSHLRLGNSEKAIRAWKRYVTLEKGSEGGRKINQYLTLLRQQHAKQEARRLIAQEKSLSENLDAKAIAVSLFQNLGRAEYARLSKGLAEMIITDLSQVKALRVVERIQIQAILNELKLAESGLVDKSSAARVGKLVGAARVTTGSYVDFDAEKIRLDAAVSRTETGKLLTASEASGALATFYELEKTLVFKILCGIGYCPESLESRERLAVEKIHTKNFKAFEHYSEGLALRDQGEYVEAARAFSFALEEDPTFDLARKALLETPIAEFDLAAMVSGGEGLGKGGPPILDLQAMSASALLDAPILQGKTSPKSLQLSAIQSQVPLFPLISQQPMGNTGGTTGGGGTGAGAPPNVNVQIQIQLP